MKKKVNVCRNCEFFAPSEKNEDFSLKKKNKYIGNLRCYLYFNLGIFLLSAV